MSYHYVLEDLTAQRRSNLMDLAASARLTRTARAGRRAPRIKTTHSGRNR
jgi:hypothetical protein